MTEAYWPVTVTEDVDKNITLNSTDIITKSKKFNIVQILQCTIALVGIVANFMVVIAFLRNKKLRCKIPNIFIINQVRLINVLLHTKFTVNHINSSCAFYLHYLLYMMYIYIVMI